MKVSLAAKIYFALAVGFIPLLSAVLLMDSGLSGVKGLLVVAVAACISFVCCALLIKAYQQGFAKLREAISDCTDNEITADLQLFDAILQKLATDTSCANEISTIISRLDQTSTDLENAVALTGQGVTHQKSEADNLAQAMESMLATAESVATNAKDASLAANNADQNARDSQQIVHETIQSINGLADQVDQAASVIQALAKDSDNIGTILDVIKGIAEQTNLLALNAAIEAARAGDQGRGFAVVADEVRSLAGRTHESTQEIESMIQRLQQAAQGAVSSMEGGRDIAQNAVEKISTASESLDHITSAITHINSMNSQIADAADGQSKVTYEINNNVEVINDVNELTVDTLEGLSAIVHDLKEITHILQGLKAKSA